MTSRFRFGLPLTLSLLTILNNCHPSSAGQAQPKADNVPEVPKNDTTASMQHVNMPDRIRLSDSVVQAAKIKTAMVTTEALPFTIDLTGEIAFDPDRAAEISARVPGRIRSVHFKEGVSINRGAPLVVIESPALAQARALYKSAVSKFQLAQQNMKRITALADKGLASGQETSLALAEEKASEAETSAAFQTLEAYGPAAHEQTGAGAALTIYSPIDGVILTRNATLGQTVAADTLLATIANFEQAYFLARLFEKDMAITAVGSIVEVRLNAYPAMVFSGVVESVGRQIDPTARTAVARICVKDQKDALKAGLFGTARLSAGVEDGRARTLVIPITSVTQLGDRKVAFVREADGSFEVHPITVGRSASGKIQVLSGLNPNETVVSEGAFALKSAVLKATFGEED